MGAGGRGGIGGKERARGNLLADTGRGVSGWCRIEGQLARSKTGDQRGEAIKWYCSTRGRQSRRRVKP